MLVALKRRIQNGWLGVTMGAYLAAVPFLPQDPQLFAQWFPSDNGAIYGKVENNNGKPLALTSIYIPEIDMRSISDSRGRFQIADIPSGEYEVVFSRVGYLPEVHRIKIEPNTRLAVPLIMRRAHGTRA